MPQPQAPLAQANISLEPTEENNGWASGTAWTCVRRKNYFSLFQAIQPQFDNSLGSILVTIISFKDKGCWEQGMEIDVCNKNNPLFTVHSIVIKFNFNNFPKGHT